MPRYHVNPETQRPNICNAKHRCDFATGDQEPPHYYSKEAARAAVEAENAKEHGGAVGSSLKKRSRGNGGAPQAATAAVSAEAAAAEAARVSKEIEKVKAAAEATKLEQGKMYRNLTQANAELRALKRDSSLPEKTRKRNGANMVASISAMNAEIENLEQDYQELRKKMASLPRGTEYTDAEELKEYQELAFAKFGAVQSMEVKNEDGKSELLLGNGRQKIALRFSGDCCSTSEITEVPEIRPGKTVSSIDYTLSYADEDEDGWTVRKNTQYAISYTDGSTDSFTETNRSNGYYSSALEWDVVGGQG